MSFFNVKIQTIRDKIHHPLPSGTDLSPNTGTLEKAVKPDIVYLKKLLSLLLSQHSFQCSSTGFESRFKTSFLAKLIFIAGSGETWSIPPLCCYRLGLPGDFSWCIELLSPPLPLHLNTLLSHQCMLLNGHFLSPTVLCFLILLLSPPVTFCTLFQPLELKSLAQHPLLLFLLVVVVRVVAVLQLNSLCGFCIVLM